MATPKKKAAKNMSSDVSALHDNVARLVENLGNKRELNEEQRRFFKRKIEQENEKHHVDQYDKLQLIITRLEDQLTDVTKPEKRKEIKNDLDKLKEKKDKYLELM